MLARAHRMVRPQDFSRAYKRGKRVGGPLLTLYFLRGAAPTRIGVVVSTKVSKKSTRRNRIKRITRETLRFLLPNLPSGDYAVVMRPQIRDAEAATIRDAVTRACSKIASHS